MVTILAEGGAQAPGAPSLGTPLGRHPGGTFVYRGVQKINLFPFCQFLHLTVHAHCTGPLELGNFGPNSKGPVQNGNKLIFSTPRYPRDDVRYTTVDKFIKAFVFLS